MSNASLSNTPEPKKSLTEAREAYQYNYTYIPPVAMVDKLPPNEEFSRDWLLMVAKQAFKLLENTLMVNRGDRGKEGVKDDLKQFLLENIQETLAEEGRQKRLKLYGQLLLLLPLLLIRALPGTAEEVEPFLNSLAERLGTDFLKPLLGNVLENIKKEAPMRKAASLEDFKALFKTIELPAIAQSRIPRG